MKSMDDFSCIIPKTSDLVRIDNQTNEILGLISFSALTLLVCREEGHLTCRKTSANCSCTFSFGNTHNSFMALFSGTTQVSRCHKRTSGLYGAKGRLTEADTLTIRLGATPSRLTTVPTSTIPHFFTGRMPFLPPNQQCQSTEGGGDSCLESGS